MSGSLTSALVTGRGAIGSALLAANDGAATCWTAADRDLHSGYFGGAAANPAVQAIAAQVFDVPVVVPQPGEYVADGAARQAAWVLSGEAEPPTWQLTIEGVETGEPTEAVYEAYAKARG